MDGQYNNDDDEIELFEPLNEYMINMTHVLVRYKLLWALADCTTSNKSDCPETTRSMIASLNFRSVALFFCLLRISLMLLQIFIENEITARSKSAAINRVI